MGRDPRARNLRAWVLATYDYCCVCGGLVDKTLSGREPDGPSLEHPLALHDGGAELDVNNARLAHTRCNSAKENRQRVARRQTPRPSRAW